MPGNSCGAPANALGPFLSITGGENSKIKVVFLLRLPQPSNCHSTLTIYQGISNSKQWS
jgi:hypothetical protein